MEATTLSGFFRDSFGILSGFVKEIFSEFSGFFQDLWHWKRQLFRDSFGILSGFFWDSCRIVKDFFRIFGVGSDHSFKIL